MNCGIGESLGLQEDQINYLGKLMHGFPWWFSGKEFTFQFRTPFAMQEMWVISLGLRESFPRQVDKKSRGPQGERGLEFSRRKKRQTFFFSTFLRII